MAEFEDKVVVITGGSRGIGAECVRRFFQQGAKVVFTYNRSKSLAYKLKKELNSKKGQILCLKLDVRNFQDCRETIQKIVKKFKRIDVLVNNAGIKQDKSLVMMDYQDWQNVLETNLGGVFNMCRASVYTFIKQRQGCIINISSVSGLIGLVGQTNYSASKAGIIGFSKALAKELAPYNIRVNVVAPGFIDTDMSKDILPKFKEEMLKLIPMKRFGKAEEIAEMVLFLASSRASYITGEIIKIDGGLAI